MMTRIIYMAALLFICTMNTSAFAHSNGYGFCANIYNGAKYGQQNHDYVLAKKVWEKLNFHSIEHGNPTISFNYNAGRYNSTFFNLCVGYRSDGNSRVMTVAKIYSTLEDMKKAL